VSAWSRPASDLGARQHDRFPAEAGAGRRRNDTPRARRGLLENHAGVLPCAAGRFFPTALLDAFNQPSWQGRSKDLAQLAQAGKLVEVQENGPQALLIATAAFEICRPSDGQARSRDLHGLIDCGSDAISGRKETHDVVAAPTVRSFRRAMRQRDPGAPRP